MAGLDVQTLKDRALRTLKGFTPSQLAILSVLGVVAIVAATAFLRWVNTPTYSVLLAGLDAKDASAVTSQLTSDGVTYQLQGGGSTVMVPSDQLDAERLKVAAAGLPASSTDSGWAVFDKQGLTSSSFQQQVAYQRALETTLGGTLAGIKGVSAASVHLALPEKSVFTEQQQPARASVLLTTRGSLDGGAVDAVTRLVASAVPNLAPEDVSVTDDKGTLLTGGGSGQGDQAKAALEDSLSTRATSMLDTLLGPGHAVVRVSAELRTAATNTDTDTYDPTKVAVTHESSSSETYDSSGAAGGTGGVVAQPTATPTAGASASSSPGAYRKEDAQKDYGVTHVVTSTKDVAGGIKRLTVAVAVDSRVKNAPTQQDLQGLVGGAVGLDPARGDTIAVTTPAFQSTPAAAKVVPASTPVKNLVPEVLGGILLVLVGLGFFRTLKTRAGSASASGTEEVTAAAVTAGQPGGSSLAPGNRALPSAHDTESLVELVDDHPDEVAHLLRGWVASTSAGSTR